jgi:hypothetical protein
MVLVRKKKVLRRKKKTITETLKEAIFSSQGFPILLTFSVIGVLFVLFRMKSIELDYKISEIDKERNKIEMEGKEIKATKARLLSVKNLRKLARKYDLKQPSSKQIIVIP